MKKLLLSILTLALFLGCSQKADKKESNTYIVGTSAYYPPFEYMENNAIVGFDIELLKELSKQIGIELKFKNLGFHELIPALKNGKIDIIASAMSATKARKKSVDFSQPYYSTQNLYLKLKTNQTINSKADLNGKKIGIQSGTLQESTAKQIAGAITFAEEEMINSILALKSGKVDAVITDSSIGYIYLKKNEDLVEFFNEPDGSEGFCIAFKKAKYTKLIAKINKALQTLKSNGTYEKLLEKYDLK